MSIDKELDSLIIDFTKSKKTLRTLTSSNSDEHNTPSYLIEAAREVMGSINLDPMSNKIANETVKASTFYTKDDDALNKKWEGKVWLNPPFSLANQSVQKLIDGYESGEITQAVLLVKSAIETKRYQKLYSYPFCELNSRVKFIPNELSSIEVFTIFFNTLRENEFYTFLLLFLLKFKLKKVSDSAPFATVLFYFGNEFYKWNEVMSKYGRVHLGNRLSKELIVRCGINELTKLGIIE